jgi:hypothetical protein
MLLLMQCVCNRAMPKNAHSSKGKYPLATRVRNRGHHRILHQERAGVGISRKMQDQMIARLERSEITPLLQSQCLCRRSENAATPEKIASKWGSQGAKEKEV